MGCNRVRNLHSDQRTCCQACPNGHTRQCVMRNNEGSFHTADHLAAEYEAKTNIRFVLTSEMLLLDNPERVELQMAEKSQLIVSFQQEIAVLEDELRVHPFGWQEYQQIMTRPPMHLDPKTFQTMPREKELEYMLDYETWRLHILKDY